MNHFKKAVLAFIFVFAFSLIAPQSLFAFSVNLPKKGPHAKLGRGIFYIVASPLQVPKEIVQKTSDFGDSGPAAIAPIEGFFVGTATGIYYALRQATVGTVDILTFYAPMNNDWAPIVNRATLVPEI